MSMDRVPSSSVSLLDSLTPAADKVPYFISSTQAGLADLTAFGRSWIQLSDAAAGRTALNISGVDNNFLAAQSFRTGAAFDGIRLVGRAGGTSSHNINIECNALTAARSWVFPDRNDTFAGLTAQTFTGQQTFSGSIVLGNGVIVRSIDTGYSVLSGSTAIDATVARIEILGKSHPTAANKISIWGGTKEFGTIGAATQMTLASTGELGIGLVPTAGNGLLQFVPGTSKANGIAMGDCLFFRNSAGVFALGDSGTAVSTATTVGANGAAAALTALPVGYLRIAINGTIRKIPYYSD